jgi:hypothetical protein
MAGDDKMVFEVEQEAEEAAQGRQRSKVAFPYNDLNSALEVANAIHDKVGNSDCSLQQLSAWMNQSIKSSGFRVQIAAARLFGVIESEGSESYRLTQLGRQIVDPENARKAKATAFMNVPLFQLIYENHKDGILPPAAALEREIAQAGVAEKQKDRARQVFERSADQAGFFEHGKNRLVMPAIKEAGVGGKETKTGDSGGGGGGSNNVGLDLDPLLIELLKKIPPTNDGWAGPQRLRWFKTFAMNVSQIYDGDNSPVELEIKLDTSAS